MSAHVFLSHSTADKPVVEELARRMREKEGIQAWLDKWNLIPGRQRKRSLQKDLSGGDGLKVANSKVGNK
jgi:hypothetical protein